MQESKKKKKSSNKNRFFSVRIFVREVEEKSGVRCTASTTVLFLVFIYFCYCQCGKKIIKIWMLICLPKEKGKKKKENCFFLLSR